MSSFRKFFFFIIAGFLVLVIIANVILLVYCRNTERPYRVEAKRIAYDMQETDTSKIDLSGLSYVCAITAFDPENPPNNDYILAEHDGRQYAIEYKAQNSFTPLIVTDIVLAVLFALILFMLVYMDRKVVRPFHSMTELTVDLAKGNLSTPIKAEKSKVFGRFLWGMDMLRENLEDSKKRELEYQKEKKTMVLSLSHDIKTPLSAIELYARAIKDGIYEEEEKRIAACDGILKNADEIKNYAGEISKISREDFLKLDVNVGEAYLSDVMKRIEVYYEDKLAVLHTEFQVGLYENCMIKCDPDRLVEVLQNLMENAIKYGDGKSIRISFSEEEDCKLISVFNTGNAPDENDMENLFDSFYRGKNAKEISGSGLGLYICKHLLLKMDGDIYAQSREDGFEVTVVIRKA